MGKALKNLLIALGVQVPVVGIAVAWWSTILQHPVAAAILAVVYEGGILVWTVLGKDVWGLLKPEVAAFLADWVKATVQNFCSGFRRRYNQQMFYEHRGFYTRGLVTPGGAALEVNQVFVELQIAPSHPFQASTNPIVFKQLSGSQPVWTFLRRLRKQQAIALAILGPPGCGKTTLLKHLALVFATKQQRRYRLRRRTPVLLFLREHINAITTESLPLGDLAQRYFADPKRYPELAPPPNWFPHQLKAGKCLVLLDGLDEVVNAAQRQQIAKWVDQQIRTYPRCRFLLTARPQGYRDAPLTGAHVLEVMSFNAKQVEQFIRNWYLAVKITSRGGRDDPGIRQEANREAGDLLQLLQQRPRLKVLTVNPLLLTMIANVHNYRGVLPQKRVELYAEICDVLLGHWRQARGVDDRLTAPQKRVVLQPLAEEMMRQKVRDMPTREALEVMTPYLKQVGVAPVAHHGFLENVQASSGVLVEQASGVWGFAHLTFQEYLCASHWQETGKARSWDSAKWQALIDDGNGWWHETLRLYAAQSDATSLVDACLQRNTIPALTLAKNIADEALKLDDRDTTTAAIVGALQERPVIALRSEPLRVSAEDALEVFGLHVQKDAELGLKVERPLEYIQNEYEEQGDVVVDHATGLMWQQSGSDKRLTYQKAQAYIKDLNRRQFANYDDWRLPTIPELMSLLEPEKQSNDLYIDPIFDRKQRWCWSADLRQIKDESSAGAAWLVGFDVGGVHWYSLHLKYYVRGVRS